MNVHRLTLSVPTDYSLKRSLTSLCSRRRDPTICPGDRHASFSLLTPDEPVVVGAKLSGKCLDIETEGSGTCWLRPKLTELFGLQDNPRLFTPAGRVRDLLKRFPSTRPPRLPVVFQRLVQIVLHQLVAWGEASDGWRLMTRRYGETAPGESGLLVGPTPAKLRSLAWYDLVTCDILPRHARLILKLTREHSRIERIWSAGDKKLIECLCRIPGIGEWTIQKLRGSCLGDSDAAVTGDYGLPHCVCWYFRRQPRSTNEEILELLEPYRGHRYRVQQLLMHAGIRAPRRGPRSRVRSWK